MPVKESHGAHGHSADKKILFKNKHSFTVNPRFESDSLCKAVMDVLD